MSQPSIRQAIGQVKQEFGGIFVVSCAINLLALATSIYMLQVFDRVLTSRSYETLGYLTLIALLAIAVLAAMELARKRILSRAGHWFEHVASPHVLTTAGEDTARGRRPTASLKDVGEVRGFVSGDGITAFFDAPWLPVFLAVLFLLHPWLGILASVGAVVLFGCALINDLLTRRRAAENREHAEKARASARELHENAEVLQSMGMRGAALDRWQRQQERALPGTLRMLDAGAAVTSMSRFVRLGLQVAILGLGAYLVLQQQLTAGGMIAGSIILSRALAPVEKSIQGWRGYLGARAGLASLKGLVGRDEPVARQALPEPQGAVEVTSVTHAPADPERPVLRDVSFSLAPGEVLGIAGPTGSGKSTVCRLLVGTFPPTAGDVRLDGAELFENIDQLGRRIGYVPQDITFVSGTVAENIARLAPDDPEKVIQAAQHAGVHELILALPDGYETDMGAYGPRLSGGQRQRLALARAFYGDPALLVLDEPNSNLDQGGEAALITAIEHAKARGCTIVLVSHRMSLMRCCDKLMVMQEGRVVRFGPRGEIMALYAARKDQQGSAGAAS
jgi:PrtD family type I secretion system ABC transporter